MGMTHEKKKLEGAKFIHDRNKWFVRGDAHKLAAKPEVLRNLDKFTVHLPSKPDNAADRAVWTTISLILALPVLITYLAIDAFLKWLQSTFSPFVVFGVQAVMIGLLIGVVIVLVVKAVHKARRDALTMRDFYSSLIQRGHRLPAQVMYTEPTFIGGQATRITYRFESPNGNELQGEYTTSAKVNFQAGDKVVVLYLDDRVHVLL